MQPQQPSQPTAPQPQTTQQGAYQPPMPGQPAPQPEQYGTAQPQVQSQSGLNTANPYAAPNVQPGMMAGAAPMQGKMSMMDILFNFNGRIRRGQYWIASLIMIGYVLALLVLAGFLSAVSPAIGLVIVVVGYIPVIWVSLAVQAKRWHDRDKSAWWILINLVPYIGGLWSFIECGCLAGTPGPNRYGYPQP